MKIMITGGKGQLGKDCTEVLQKSHDIISIDVDDLDITNFPDVETRAKSFAPDYIINCAAYTQVDACETHKEAAWNVNVKGPENLARCVEKHGGTLIHISTDYVFDGEKNPPDPYYEEDTVHPVSVYGRTKLEGERIIRATTSRHIILRTAWMYGVHGRNFIKTLLSLSLKNPRTQLKVVNDQFGSPTWSYRLALQIAHCIGKPIEGIYHATSEGYCTWYELICYFLNKMDVPHTIIPCSTEEYPTPATRPKNSILENRQFKRHDLNIMKDWHDDIDQFIDQYRQRLFDEAQREVS
ncbi:MAG: dTDP-4-dehydrorhamnose reductase [bacterium]